MTFVKKVFYKLLDIPYEFLIRNLNKNRDFSLISNNCWGGRIYEDYNLPYLSPTVGLFFYADDYIKFLKDLEVNLSSELKFLENSKYEIANIYRESNRNYYPIGVLNDDIEIHFLHYSTNQDAYEKWERRRKRVNFDNLYVKMCDQNLCNYTHIEEFFQLPFKNKIFFSSKNYTNFDNLVYFSKFRNNSSVGDLYNDRWSYRLVFNSLKWLNSK